MQRSQHKSARLFLQYRTQFSLSGPTRAPLTLLYAVDSVKQPGRDVEEGRPQDPGHQPPGPGDAAEVPCPGGLADVDVALDSQDQGQPDGDVVEHLGSRLHEQLV